MNNDNHFMYTITTPTGGATPTTPFEPQQEQQSPAQTQSATTSPTNRFSYDTSLDARDSALIQLDGPLLDVAALSPQKPAPDLSNIIDLELNNDFFSQTGSTAATSVDPWGGGQASHTGNVQTNQWSMQGGGNQQTNPWSMQSGNMQSGNMQGGGNRQTNPWSMQSGNMQRGNVQGGNIQTNPWGGGQQPATGYGRSGAYGQPAQVQGNPWGASGRGQQPGAPPPVPPHQGPQKVLSQQEFDQLWDELCTPTTNF